jgi:hypothetical protein
MTLKSLLAVCAAAASVAAATPLVAPADAQLAGGPLCVANRCPYRIIDDATVDGPRRDLAGGPLCVGNRCPHAAPAGPLQIG